MIKKMLIFIIVLFALLGLYFVYNYFIRPIAEAPIKESVDNGFNGPNGLPSIKGPSGPPPT